MLFAGTDAIALAHFVERPAPVARLAIHPHANPAPDLIESSIPRQSDRPSTQPLAATMRDRIATIDINRPPALGSTTPTRRSRQTVHLIRQNTPPTQTAHPPQQGHPHPLVHPLPTAMPVRRTATVHRPTHHRPTHHRPTHHRPTHHRPIHNPRKISNPAPHHPINIAVTPDIDPPQLAMDRVAMATGV